MKQIILKPELPAISGSTPCLFKLALLWGAYGLVVAAIWQCAGSDFAAKAAVWALAVAAAAGLALKTAEV
jgi:hypothetical protein